MNILVLHSLSAAHLVHSLLQTKSQVPQAPMLHMAFGSLVEETWTLEQRVVPSLISYMLYNV